MIISNKKKFIYVHIWKTGGTSITSSLSKYARPIEKISEGYYLTRKLTNILSVVFGVQDNGKSWLNGVHKHATSSELKVFVGEQIWNEYFTFTIVRNPYNWLLSWYYYVKSSKFHKEFSATNKIDFNKWVKENIRTKKFRRQTDFILENNNIIVDFIGKLENIDKDYSFICEQLNIEKNNLPFKNKTDHNDFFTYYDNDLIDDVNKYFKKDFEVLGYKMNK